MEIATNTEPLIPYWKMYVDLCIARVTTQSTGSRHIPAEVRRIVKDYVGYLPLTDDTIKKAVTIWCKPNKDSRHKLLMQFGHIAFWDVSQVTDMSNLFAHQIVFNDNISTWDVRKVHTMRRMFLGVSLFNQPLNTWNTCN